METNIKQRIAAGALALSLLGGSGVGVAAQQNQGAAGGLVGVLVGVQGDPLVNVEIVDSFNNLTALNNFLNNSPILSNNTDFIDVTVAGNDIVISVLSGPVTTLDDSVTIVGGALGG